MWYFKDISKYDFYNFREDQRRLLIIPNFIWKIGFIYSQHDWGPSPSISNHLRFLRLVRT